MQRDSADDIPILANSIHDEFVTDFHATSDLNWFHRADHIYDTFEFEANTKARLNIIWIWHAFLDIIHIMWFRPGICMRIHMQIRNSPMKTEMTALLLQIRYEFS